MDKYLFLIIAGFIFLCINYFTYKRFLLKLEVFKKYRIVLNSIIILIFAAEVFYFLTLKSEFLSSSIFIFFASLIGISFILFIIALFYDIFYYGLNKFNFFEQRRKLYKITYDFIFIFITIFYIFYGFSQGLSKPEVKNYEIEIGNLDKQTTLIHLSDIHIGKLLKSDFLEYLVEKTNQENPDFIAITGDLIDFDPISVKNYLTPLKNLKSKYGTFYVLGNHEYFNGAEKSIEVLKDLGINVLLNDSVTIKNRFNIAGINDLAGIRFGIYEPDIKKALQKTDKTLPTILLSHQPKSIKLFENEKIDLALFGHTHGGQIFPFGLFVLLDQPYLSGLYEHNGIKIAVNQGAGFWGPPMRTFSKPEILKIVLKPKEDRITQKNGEYMILTNMISQLFGLIANTNFPTPIQNFINKTYVDLMGVDLGEFEEIEKYESLNKLFTRSLKQKREFSQAQKDLISPCDSFITELGSLKGDTLLQIKGMKYSASELLSDKISIENKKIIENGTYINFYLSPKDYHRYHAPIDMKVLKAIYIPGKLYPVNLKYLNKIPSLFVENERVVLECKNKEGKLFYMIFVGALNVGKMVINFEPKIKTNAKIGEIVEYSYDGIDILKGDELGMFEMGSTIVMIFEKEMVNFNTKEREKVKFGETIGTTFAKNTKMEDNLEE